MLQSMRIIGGQKLVGEISISGAKNLALPALSATILTDAKITIHNVPKLSDVQSMTDMLAYFGADINYFNANSISLKTEKIHSTTAPYDFVRKMRASILMLGPLLARCHQASVSLPGGCAIGARGVNLHLQGMEQLGAQVNIENGYINAIAKNGLHGCDIVLPSITVTGTENILMAACLAKGTTRIINAAVEPEIVAFCNLLNKMGAKISNHGTSTITIHGVESMNDAEFTLIPDRIEAGTYAIAAAITNGKILLKNCDIDHLTSFFDALSLAGVSSTKTADGVLVERTSNCIKCHDIQTAPYPGFPTDLQAQYTALMAFCDGSSSVTENIFENRFMHIPELVRMGAEISMHGKTATICGKSKLTGANVMATDLRASVALVLAGLASQGETIVNRLYHIDRGYENIEEKLRNCGANIERIQSF